MAELKAYMPIVKKFGDEVISEGTPPVAWRHDYQHMGIKQVRRFYDSEPDFLYLDTETTSLSPVFAGFVQIGILDKAGNVLFSELIMPEAEIHEKAFKAHGISQRDLEEAGAKPFPHHYERLYDILKGRSVVIYNAKFDSQFMQGQCLRYGLAPFIISEWFDLMAPCSALLGTYKSQYRDFEFIKLSRVGDILKVPLPDNLHDAIADCHLTRGVMERMRWDLDQPKLEEGEK